uniref:Uncharacterized protein MANES_04G062500 n=1 Tax=Rhizophora mucronata TaxID=61149 RepID=A0A2P2KFN0_RHIMU
MWLWCFTSALPSPVFSLFPILLLQSIRFLSLRFESNIFFGFGQSANN